MPKAESKVVFNADNTHVSIEGSILTIRMDTSKRLRPSRPTVNKKTGVVIPPKSMVVGTTGGNKPIVFYPDGSRLCLSVTAYVPNLGQAVKAEAEAEAEGAASA